MIISKIKAGGAETDMTKKGNVLQGEVTCVKTRRQRGAFFVLVISRWLSLVVRDEAGVINVKLCHGDTCFAQAKALALS